MSEVILLVLLEAVVGYVQLVQGCSGAGSPAWSEQLRYVLSGCENTITAPDGELRLVIGTEGQVNAFANGGVRLGGDVRPVEPPAMISWSPVSNAFFVNDGEGSGMTSVFRLFRITSGRIVEDEAIGRKAVELFRAEKKCGPKALNPDVWGFGWSKDGRELYILVRPTVHNPCGPPDSFLTLVVNSETGAVTERLGQQATAKRFRLLLPAEILRR